MPRKGKRELSKSGERRRVVAVCGGARLVEAIVAVLQFRLSLIIILLDIFDNLYMVCSLFIHAKLMITSILFKT